MLRLEHGRVARVAPGEFASTARARLRICFERRGGPPETEQRLVGLHARRAARAEVAARASARLPAARRSRARRWPCRAGCGTPVAGCALADARRATRCRPSVSPLAHQRHAEVVAGIDRGRAPWRAALKHLGRPGVVAARHQHVGLSRTRSSSRSAGRCFSMRASASSASTGSRAGSGSWRGRTRRDRAPLRRRASFDQLGEDLRRLPCACRTTGACRRAAPRPRRRAATRGRMLRRHQAVMAVK